MIRNKRGKTRNRNTILFITIFAVIIAGYSLISVINLQVKLEKALDEKKILEASLTALKQQVDLELSINNLKSLNEELAQEIDKIKRIHKAEILHGLVGIESMDSSIVIDLRYATEDNFTGKQIYRDNSIALLRRETAIKLLQANNIFKEDGYTIKIWDAYRPLYAQQALWDHAPNSGFVANPQKGSKHNRGAAVDITLVDESGNEVEMPTEFDSFTDKAFRNSPDHSDIEKKNVEYITRVMQSCGFKGISNEWWHFDDINSLQYPLLDVDFDAFQ